MPLSFVHPVAVIPIHKYFNKHISTVPLIIGSMAPDIAYLTPYLVHQRMDSHSLLGIYLFCIPMGLTIYFLYHLLMTPVIMPLLPKTFGRHFHNDFFIGRLPNTPSHTVILSIVLGAMTHIAWDFFTHQSGVPQYIPWMDIPLMSIDGYEIMPYRVLQHSSTLIGLVFLSYWLYKWHKKKNHSFINQQKTKQQEKLFNDHNSEHYKAPKSFARFSLILLFGVSFLAGLIKGYMHLPETDVLYGMYGLQIFIRHAILGSVATFLICCMSLGLMHHYIKSRL